MTSRARSTDQPSAGTHALDTEQDQEPRASILTAPSRVKRLYVVLVFLGCLVLANLAAPSLANYDPNAIAQNARLKFQTSATTSSHRGLGAYQRKLLDAVLKPTFPSGPASLRILYVSNSQSMGIMDRHQGDLTSPQWLQLHLLQATHRSQDTPLVRVGSLPNVSFQELLLRLVAESENGPRVPNVLIVGIPLDTFRKIGVRDSLVPEARSPRVQRALRTLDGRLANLPLAQQGVQGILLSGGAGDGAGNASTGVAQSSGTSVASSIESTVQSAANRLPLFRYRSKLYGRAIDTLLTWRDRLLGISTSSARAVPRQDYLAGLQILQATMLYANLHHIHMVLFLNPQRPVTPHPYVMSDLQTLRRDIPRLCHRYHASCFDYTWLVPERLWTNYPALDARNAGQRDFAHFTGAGHKLLARRLFRDTRALFERWEGETSRK